MSVKVIDGTVDGKLFQDASNITVSAEGTLFVRDNATNQDIVAIFASGFWHSAKIVTEAK